MERRKASHPNRPLIRISSTFFWHLSSDYELVPIPDLSERAEALNVTQNAYQNTVYERIKVGQQVQK
jgi:hypothetical protein